MDKNGEIDKKIKGIITIQSQSSVRDTMEMLAASLKRQGATVYARINQQDEALKNGIKLPPLEYILFGSPKQGAALMAKDPLIALDLPLKIICWQNQDGKTQVTFNTQDYIASRYGLPTSPDSPLNLLPVIVQALNK